MVACIWALGIRRCWSGCPEHDGLPAPASVGRPLGRHFGLKGDLQKQRRILSYVPNRMKHYTGCMFMHRIEKYLTILLTTALLAACAVKPETATRQPVQLDEAEELRLGQDNDTEIRKNFGVHANARLQAYVQAVGGRLAPHGARPHLHYRFTVLDSPKVNAFALPGADIYITRGLLAYLNSEAELAAILSHEIGHVSARHAVSQYSIALTTKTDHTHGALLTPQNVRTSPSLLATLGPALQGGYGRESELEAYRLGAEAMARADYDPRVMIAVVDLFKNQQAFEQQWAEQEGRAPRVYHGAFTIQPGLEDLQQVVMAAERFRNPANVRIERRLYLKLLDGLVWGDSEAQGIRRGTAFYHRGLNLGLRFPPGWRVDNNPQRLLAISSSGDALLQMQITAQGAVRTPQEYLVVGMQLRDLRDTRAFKVDGLPGYSGVARLQTPFGSRDARVAVVFMKKQAFRFYMTERTTLGDEQLFFETVQSLYTLSAPERALARAQRVELITARTHDRFATLAKRSSLTHEPQTLLRLLNGKFPQGEPTPGDLIKIIQ